MYKYVSCETICFSNSFIVVATFYGIYGTISKLKLIICLWSLFDYCKVKVNQKFSGVYEITTKLSLIINFMELI